MTSFDEIAGDLQALRVAAGSPSYAEIALRITKVREERGELGGRPARTTVYDAFRMGRRRLDTALVLDIVRALGVDEVEVEVWAERCRTARADAPVPAGPVDGPAADAALDEDPEPDPDPPSPIPVPTLKAVLLCLGCVALNLLGRQLVDAIQLPLYLDMTGTAIAAVLLGPWWGAGVGLATNTVGSSISGWESLPFALVNVAGALVWGYGIRRWRLGSTLPRYAALSCVVALTCSMIAVPIIVAMDGITGHGADSVTATILDTVGLLWLAVASSNVLTSLADKVISGFMALLAVDVLPRSVTAEVRPLMPLGGERSAAPLRSPS